MEQPELRIPSSGADRSSQASDQQRTEAWRRSARVTLLDRTTRIAAGFHRTVGDFLMPRRPAKVTQADIARALRAAKEARTKLGYNRRQRDHPDCHYGER